MQLVLLETWSWFAAGGVWGCLGKKWGAQAAGGACFMSAFQPQATMGSCALLFVLVLSCHPSKVDGDHLSATPPEGLKVFQRQRKGSAFPCPAAPRWRAGMPCRKRTGRQTRLLTLLKREVGALRTKEGDCPGMHGRNLQFAHCSTAWRISWARSLCPPGGQSSSTQPWVLFGGTVSPPTRVASSLACVRLPLSVPKTVRGTDP